MNNEALGVVSLREALKLADEAEVDLVEIAPQANPAVCRLMDFGKFRSFVLFQAFFGPDDHGALRQI